MRSVRQPSDVVVVVVCAVVVVVVVVYLDLGLQPFAHGTRS